MTDFNHPHWPYSIDEESEMPVVTVRISEILKAKLDALSVSSGESINQLSVLAIDRLVNEYHRQSAYHESQPEPEDECDE